MSDSEHSTVTYTSVPFPVEDDSDIGSPGIDGPPIMPEDPYAYIMAAYEVPPSSDYIPGPEEDEILPAEEQPLPTAAASPTVDSPGYVLESYPEEEPEEDDEDLEEDLADYPADRDDDDDKDEDEDEDEEEEEHPRVRFASPTPSHEVGESSAAGAARQDRHAIVKDDPYSIAREDLYGFVNMVDVPPRFIEILVKLFTFGGVHCASPTLVMSITDEWDDLVGAFDEIAPTTLEGVNQRVTDLSTIVEQETTIMYGIMEDAQDDLSQLRGRVNMLYRDRPIHMAQSALISELQSADHKRQGVIKELWASDYKRQVQLTKALQLLKGLQTQMTEFQRHHGPAKGSAWPDAPGEAGRSS
ncbi:hypothetical protein Tco_0576819 [Tanacetum coccineum]